MRSMAAYVLLLTALGCSAVKERTVSAYTGMNTRQMAAEGFVLSERSTAQASVSAEAETPHGTIDTFVWTATDASDKQLLERDAGIGYTLPVGDSADLRLGYTNFHYHGFDSPDSQELSVAGNVKLFSDARSEVIAGARYQHILTPGSGNYAQASISGSQALGPWTISGLLETGYHDTFYTRFSGLSHTRFTATASRPLSERLSLELEGAGQLSQSPVIEDAAWLQAGIRGSW